ncbi:hypothetical protein [Pseudomonas sp. RC10]|uniref:hypothetical protein n=1 Tax=Pseudomonas bambusae TaxID=3139142 RepID=UPI003139B335
MEFFYSDQNLLTAFDAGLTRDEVRQALGWPSKVLPKTPFNKNEVDVFGAAMMRVWYDEKWTVEEVELYSPAASLVYRGEQVLGVSMGCLKLALSSIGEEWIISESDECLTIAGGRIKFTVPDVAEDALSTIVRAVCISITP